MRVQLLSPSKQPNKRCQRSPDLIPLTLQIVADQTSLSCLHIYVIGPRHQRTDKPSRAMPPGAVQTKTVTIRPLKSHPVTRETETQPEYP